MDSFTWIQTRDGSPTLWYNNLAEPFRSLKGAFTETWHVFVKPALEQALRLERPVSVGEFGLGVGTNWLLWSLAAKAMRIPHNYFVIERESGFFVMGLSRWKQNAPLISQFLERNGIKLSEKEIIEDIEGFKSPSIYGSLMEAQESSQKADIWFHDPFGFTVNPEAYHTNTLELCRNLWAPGCMGYSYACNRHFQESLESLGQMEVSILPTGHPDLKRERLTFLKLI